MNLGKKIITIIGIVQDDNESPKFHRIYECELCHKKTIDLYKFNNAILCKECLEEQKKRFPKVKT